VVHGAGLVGEHWIGQGETPPEAVQVARARECDQHYRGGAELGQTVAHGDRVLIACQSGQMTMEDQRHRQALLLRHPPLGAVIIR
jgi:hypothetical protein